MQKSESKGCLSAIGSVFNGIDLARRLVMNVLFLALLVLVLALLRQPAAVVPGEAALVIAPQGMIVEQLSGDPIGRAIAELREAEEAQTLLQDLLDAIEAARDDDAIKALLLDLNYMSGGGLSKLQEVRAAIDEFKTSGKKVIAAADYYTRSTYYLASAADEIYLHEEGLALLDGYGVFPTYYHDAIERLEIDWNVFRVGEFKSAVEPYTRNDMSPEVKESNLDWLSDLWGLWLTDVARARNLSPEVLEESIANYDVHVVEAGGEAAQAALRLGLVDVIGDRPAVRQRMVELVGESRDEEEVFSQIHFWDYLSALGRQRPRFDHGGEAIGVIVASGMILDGEQLPGTIGGDSTAQLIRQARRDDSIKAVVLRVDSGGGSQFASEVIRRELELLNASDKPLIVSMSSVAASGGYWIATEADEIWASPSTVTGSIGIYAMVPTFQRSLEEIGINVDGVGTNWLAGALRVDRELHPRLATIIRSTTEQNYQEFLELVAEARDLKVEEVDSIARGRVWSGVDARLLGLVDELGGLHQALAAAAARAGLGEGYSVRYLEPPLDFADRLLLDALTRSARFLTPVTRQLARPSALESTVGRFLLEQAERLSRFNDPRGIYAHCMCEIDG